MIHISSLATVASIGHFLQDSAYDVEHLSEDLNLSDGLFATHENLEPLLAKTDGESRLAILARLFFVCWPVDRTRCRSALPDSFLQAAFDCGLLVQEQNEISSTACLVPFRSRIIACDSARTRSALVDMVTGPSAATHFPARLAIGGENETSLDLGTGTGALALEAARYSRNVIGTDINPRTLQFAEFNAALNGVTNVEWRCGDAFAPVGGQRFTRVFSNPPFFLSPAMTFTYCDSPLELDGFTARLAKEAPSYLEEGGFYQMICEWVEIEGQPWEQRLREWTAESGCDVLVLVAPRLTPLAYAEKRAKEARLMQASSLEHSFAARLSYLTDHQVKNIIGGVITMRKRSGAGSNWFTVLGTEPTGNEVGPSVRARFDSLTFLASATEEQIFASKLRMAEDVVLETRAEAAEKQWHTTLSTLIKQDGLADRLRVDEQVSSFLPLFDGTNTLSGIASLVAERLRISDAEAHRRCLQLARRLLQSNFVAVNHQT